MSRILRAGAVLAAAFALALPFAAPAASAPAPAPAPSARPAAHLAPGQWPQAISDVAADPSIRFGALPNGMRYAIRKQSTPAGQTSLRLWFDAGSLMETDAQQGLAHFLEHMAFNGSKAVKEGEMIKILERLGLAFGPDTNAGTGFSETTYQLDLPRSDAQSLDTALMLLRETASNLTLAQDAVDRERGVVLSEERARDTPQYRMFIDRMTWQLKGQRLPTRLPIGKVDVLKTAPAGQIRDFYARWYRPERAVLVAVGDFDVDAMEARVKASFADWTAQAPAAEAPDQGRVAPRGAEARVFVDPGVNLSAQLAWLSPPDLSPDTAEKRRRDLIESLGLSVLNRRYSAIQRGANPPFLRAQAYKGDQEQSVSLAGVQVGAAPGKWREALAAAEQEQRRIVRYGVRQDELDREIEEARAGLRADAAGAATRRQVDLASDIVETLSERTVVTSPEQDLAMFEAAVKGLKAETVNAALRTVFSGQGPLVYLASPTPVEGGEATVLAALTASQKVAVLPPAAAAQVNWPYVSFGKPGQVAERREIADLGVTFIRFQNGVCLTLKPTKFRDDEVRVRVNVGQGNLALPRDRQSPYWAARSLIEGGLGKLDVETMEKVLAAKVFGAQFSITDDAFVLDGGTRTGDLPTQMQVLAAYMTDPGWRPSGFERIKVAGKTIHDQFEATDSGVMQRDLAGLVHSGDRRWTFPGRQEMADARLDDLRAVVDPAFRDGPVEVVIVGDIQPDAAIAAVAATFGALPPRREPAPVTDRAVPFPRGAPQPVVLTHKGRADQAIGYIAWGTTDYWADPQRARDVAVLREIMKLRITDELREAQGVTYSPDVQSQHSLVWTGWGYIAASIEATPDKLPGFFADTLRIARDLAETEVGADELERARTPRVQGLQRGQLTNGYWVGELSGAQADPRRLDVIREIVPGTQRVTAADVRRAAQQLLRPEAAYRLEVVPQARPGG